MSFSIGSSEFEGMVDVVYRVHNGLRVRPKTSYEQALWDKLRLIERGNSFSLERADIQQQLALLWLSWLAGRKSKKQGIRTYLLRLSVFGLRDWYRAQVRAPDKSSGQPAQEEYKLDLHWLLYDEDGPFSGLSPYERYLVYLHYVQGLNIIEISRVIHRDRKAVGRTLSAALTRLRSKHAI